MSHIRGGSIEWNKSMESKNNFFRILRVIQIGVLIIGTLLFLAWCGSYLLIGPRTHIVTYEIAEPLVAEEDCCDKAEHKTDDDDDNGLLPGDVIPQNYNLTLNVILPPEPEAFTTKGKVDIVVNCVKDTEVIFLHARDIHVDSASVTPLYSISQNELQKNSTNDNITSDVPAYGTEVRRMPKKQMIAIHVEKSLRSGSQYLLEIFFKGNINNISVGLYRSSYPSENGTTSWFASTQFQPSDARRVFPCFDEPGLKATFSVSLASKKGAVSLSNMPSLKTITLEDDIQVVTYMETPRMSTYILSFIVGDIEAYTEERQEGIKVWSRKDMSQFGGHAQNVTPKILHFLEDYIEIPFSMPKLDLVAVPNFLHAAMENWGLIIFSESALLYDPEKSSTENKVYVTLVIAHELAHQWFGNLVTPAWWDHIWLNEGFATYYEYLAVDALEPLWEITHVFLATIYEVMETDSLMTTRAMGAPVHPDEVLETFDQIAYIKGGAVVRMLHHFIGDPGFRQGLKNYLWQNSFKSATENSLWQNLNLWNRNKHDVKRVMTSWTSQSGYPVVKFVRDYENRTAVITQKQFSLEYDATEDIFKVRDQRFWYVPVTYTHGSELDWSTKTDFWLTSVSDVVKDLPEENTWIIANIQQVGYYRVNYDLQNWELIIEQLVTNHTAIHVINRAQLLNDALNLARSDQAEYAMALNMTKYLFLEEEYLPWQAALAAFKYLDIMLAKSEGHAAWKEYVLTIMTPIYQKLGWSAEIEDGDVPSKFLRKKILRWSCDYDHPDCVENALSMFKQWKEGPASNLTISADDREIVLCTGISRGPSEDWELMWKRYLNENFKAEKKLLLKSLACTRETRLLRKLLRRAMMSSSGIPLEDGSDAFVYVAENFYGRDIVYDFFKKNMDEISLRFGAYAFAGGKLVDEVTASLNSENEIKELESILKGRKSTLRNGMQKSLQLVLQRTKNNLRWLERNNDLIQKWLQENSISL